MNRKVTDPVDYMQTGISKIDNEPAPTVSDKAHRPSDFAPCGQSAATLSTEDKQSPAGRSQGIMMDLRFLVESSNATGGGGACEVEADEDDGANLW